MLVLTDKLAINSFTLVMKLRSFWSQRTTVLLASMKTDKKTLTSQFSLPSFWRLTKSQIGTQ